MLVCRKIIDKKTLSLHTAICNPHSAIIYLLCMQSCTLHTVTSHQSPVSSLHFPAINIIHLTSRTLHPAPNTIILLINFGNFLSLSFILKIITLSLPHLPFQAMPSYIQYYTQVRLWSLRRKSARGLLSQPHRN